MQFLSTGFMAGNKQSLIKYKRLNIKYKFNLFTENKSINYN